MEYPNSLKNLIESLKKLPTIGEKSAERLAFAILSMDEEDANLFSESIMDVKKKIKKCKVCGNITEKEVCNICESDERDSKTICVVEDSKNIISLEKIGTYNGKYHVKNEKIDEIIIAISPTLEGETTALYISKILESENVIVSRIAYGIPLGADMEYLDPMTLSMALNNRNKIS